LIVPVLSNNFAVRIAALSIKQASREILLSLAAVVLLSGISPLVAAASKAPWEKPRSLADFQSLLDHSPFSLPTAEESSPLADRYALTGIVTIDGQEEIFVFDRTDQSREMLSHTPNEKNMALVALVRDGDAAPQKATIRVGTDTGTISYLEAAPQPAAQPITLQGPAGNPNTIRPGMPRLPPFPQTPSAPGTVMGPARPNVLTPQTRRIIRRPMVNPPQSSSPTP
jgi:hypothetical protein